MMRTIKILLVVLLFAHAGRAQQKAADSLLMVKDFLYEIKLSIPAKSDEVTGSINKLQTLLRREPFYRQLIGRQIAIVMPGNTTVSKEMIQQFKFIVQSAALLRSDLKQAGLQSKAAQNEVKYLNRNIQPLADQLTGYSKKAMEVQ
ncbi:MAG: hypothetical protein QM731_05535 [Chitinophagaceae bacterium]